MFGRFLSEKTMNKELVKLAKEKDFLGYFPKEWEYHTKEPLRYYFWLCELQKWLRDKYNIHVEVLLIDTLTNIYVYYILATGNVTRVGSHKTSYEIAFEDGLLEALNLI